MKTPEHLKWLKANGHDLGAFTGTDIRALAAVAATWELYAYTGDDEVLLAIGLLTRRMQRKTRPFARELAAFVMDWSDRDRLWPLVEAEFQRITEGWTKDFPGLLIEK